MGHHPVVFSAAQGPTGGWHHQQAGDDDQPTQDKPADPAPLDAQQNDERGADHLRQGESHSGKALVLSLTFSRCQAHLHTPLPPGADRLADHMHERSGT